MPRLSLLLFALGATFLPFASVQAAPFQSAPLFRASDLSLRTLPNGVRSLVKRAPGAPTLSVQVWVRAGSRFETQNESGVAHLVETAAVSASKNQPVREVGEGGLAGALRAVGGDVGALTSRDATFYSATVAPGFAAQATRALADSVIRPDLEDEAVDEIKLEVIGDLARRASDSVALASDLAYETAFARHPYRRAAWGDDESVAALTGATARAFHKRLYVGTNVSVVVVGDISFERAHELVRQNFGALARGVKAAPVFPTEPPLKAREVSRRATLGRNAVALAWRSAPINNPRDVAALDTLLSLWREGASPVLRQKLLRGGEDSTSNPPLASAYEVDFLTQRDAGLFLITLAGTSDKDAALRAVASEIERAQKGGVSPNELKRAKDLLRRQYLAQGETPAGQAGSLGFYDVIASYQFAQNYLSLCASVTKADVERVAQKYFGAKGRIRVDVEPLAPGLPEQPEIPKPGDPLVIPTGWNGN